MDQMRTEAKSSQDGRWLGPTIETVSYRYQGHSATISVGNNLKTPNGKVNFRRLRTIPDVHFFACVYRIGYMCRMIIALEILGDSKHFTLIF
jgi:hypothetical protein